MPSSSTWPTKKAALFIAGDEDMAAGLSIINCVRYEVDKHPDIKGLIYLYEKIRFDLCGDGNLLFLRQHSLFFTDHLGEFTEIQKLRL